jgi:S4 domain protein YaaA
MKTVKIHTEYITLGQFLKHINIVSSGGEVKHFLSNNRVLVDNINDDRRGRKIYPNNIVTVLNQDYLIVANEN